MSDKQTDKYIYVSNLDTISWRPGYEDAEGALEVRPKRRTILPIDEVNKRIIEAVNQITDTLNSLPTQEGKYAVDEVEIDFAVDKSGKINILFADVGGTIRHTVKVRWKRQLEKG